MPDLTAHPLYQQTNVANAALIEACGRVFAAAHAREESISAIARDEVAAQSVAAFLAALAPQPEAP